MSDAVVFTVGHSTRPLQDFIGLLEGHAVARVMDVYTHVPGLGGFRHTHPGSPNGGWRNASFRGYADYMQTPEFAETLAALIGQAKRERIALMCAEAVPWRCHRSLIADALVARHIRAEEIVSPTRTQAHALTSFAKVDGTAINYPGA